MKAYQWYWLSEFISEHFALWSLLSLFLFIKVGTTSSFIHAQSGVADTSLINHSINTAQLLLDHLPDSSLALARHALNDARKIKFNDGIIKSHQIIGNVFQNHGAFSKALEHFTSALTLARLVGDYPNVASTLNALGDLYYFIRQPDRSLENHLSALTICRLNKLIDLEAITLGKIGHFYEKQSDYEKAPAYQSKALAIYQQLKDYNGLSEINGNIGSIHEDLNELLQAESYFLKALDFNLKTENKQARIVHFNNLGDVNRKKGSLENALNYTLQALELAKELDQKYQIESGYKDLAKTYAIQTDYQKAFEYLTLANTIYEELYDEQTAQQIVRMQSVLEISKKEKEIELLEREKRIALILRNAGIGGLILLALLGGIIISRQRLKIRKNKELHKTQQELAKVALEHVHLNELKLKSEIEAQSNQLTAHALHLIQKNKMLRELQTKLLRLSQQHKTVEKPISTLLQKINESFSFDKDWDDFKHIFEKVHPEFYANLNTHFPDLTAGEIRLAALLKLNLDSKDMSTILGISQDSLRVNRYRLRRKLKLEKGENLTQFIMTI